MKSIIYLLFPIILISFIYAYAQENREQSLGIAKEEKKLILKMQGTVRSEESGKTVPNADITVKESSRDEVIGQTKANASGAYEVDIPRGMDIEVKAQAPQFFYDAFKVRVGTDDTTSVLTHDFSLPSQLKLRLNFPTNKYDNPYPHIIDEDGQETNIRWQQAIESVAEDLIKYQEYISKVTITGHTDPDGTDKFNMELGENRALFLMNELQKAGVPAAIMEVRSAGESELLEKRPGEDEKTWKKRCRRVVMTKEMAN